MSTPTGTLFQNPIVKPLSSNATFMAGCTATFYLTETTQLTNIYADGALTTPLANPLSADASGTFVAIYLDPSVVYRVRIKTATGVLISDTDPIVPTLVLTAAGIGAALYPRTAAEVAASVTPTTLTYPPGDIRRYGADPSGVTDSSTAWAHAIAANAFVYDGFPGGGTYLFNTTVPLQSHVQIQGAIKNINGSGQGTVFVCGTAVGANNPMMHATTILEDFNVKDVTFAWQSVTTGQISILSDVDTRSCRFTDCAWINTVGVSYGVNVTGVKLAGGGTFTGDVTFDRCYFAALQIGVDCEGSCTTVRFISCELYGNNTIQSASFTGSISGTTLTVASSPAPVGAIAVGQIVGGNRDIANATQILSQLSGTTGGAGTYQISVSQNVSSQAMGSSLHLGLKLNNTGGQVISGCTFENWGLGIYSGAPGTRQIANYFEGSVAWDWHWNNGTSDGNLSCGDLATSGGALASFVINNATGNVVLGGSYGFFVDSNTANVFRGYIEQGRGVANGHWQTRTFSAGNYTASGSMTASVSSGNVATETWTINGDTCTFNVDITGFTLGGVAAPEFDILLPGSLVATNTVATPCIVVNNGVATSVGFAQVNASGTSLRVFVDATGATNWTLSSNSGVKASISFQINSSVP